jgi:predicted RNA binding protein YcfA (HicA-like mRNA interferase family)
MADKEVNKLLRALRSRKAQAEGWSVLETRGNHYEVRRHGKRVTTIPKTPGAYRSMRNTVAHLKRGGFSQA